MGSYVYLTFNDLVLDEEELLARMLHVRMRILGVFRRATVPETRRRVRYIGSPRTPGGLRSSGNAIHGCDDKIGDLAQRMCAEFVKKDRRGGHVLTLKDLPVKVVASHKERLLLSAIADLEHRLVSWVLTAMRDIAEIWYEYTEGGIWQAEQSSVDEHIRWHRAARELKFDRRPLHGRPRSQVKSRGVPPGTSIGGSKQGRRMAG